MNNFTFHNPTKIVFGCGSVAQLSKLIPEGTKTILLTYGGGSIVRLGIYDQVIQQLERYEVIPFGGIEPNPDCHTLDKAIAIAKEKEVDLVLAVGGGSVIDGSKVIAAGVFSSYTTSWEMVINGEFKGSIPLGTVLTVPATGSEMNAGAVISNRATREKYGYRAQHPLFSVLDPTYTYTLSQHQVACGIADVWMHTLEQYLTYPGQSNLMDRMAEGVLSNVLDFAPLRLEKSDDYDVACEYMLSATIALNGFLGMGVEQDWVTHKIGHEVTALTGATHGASLMMILPSVLRVMRAEKEAKLLQMGIRVFRMTDPTAEEVIIKIEDFIHSLGLAASLTEAGISKEVAVEIADRFEERGESWGEGQHATPERIREILLLASK
ncbi:MAG: iron-containing alcohol dehydrogenase [Porphyromonas sp.]|nr:iron-containing alcohol dehydrogenase [Porphyromonas sp.]